MEVGGTGRPRHPWCWWPRHPHASGVFRGAWGSVVPGRRPGSVETTVVLVLEHTRKRTWSLPGSRWKGHFSSLAAGRQGANTDQTPV